MRALLFLIHAAVTAQKMAGDAVVSALWRLIVYGTNMARLLFDVTELEIFRCSTRQSYQNCVQEPCHSSALCNNIFVRIWINLKSKYWNHLNPSTEMNGLSYFTIQIQSWTFTLIPSPTVFQNV